MLATVIWIGGLAALTFLVLPATRKSVDPSGYAALLGAIQKRFNPIAWLCLALLVATGMLQMSASPRYEGFLAVSNPWASAILIKHLFIFGMVAVSAYLTWWVLPALQRAALLRAAGRDVVDSSALERQEVLLIRINFILGIVILALTAVARVNA